MFQTEWPVLLVDDDPDVLAVSKLAMKSFEIDGVPIKLFTATSKDEAVKLLSGPLGSTALPYVSVAFIDVVMETDHAGLELCRYIRETQMNRMTTIYVRTGQPGLAPERDVIDRYDINGYFSKAETTEDKLYSLVKAGIRQFDFASMTVLE
jgi:CheY-like chemotaxis protein